MSQHLFLQSLVVFGTLASGQVLGPCCFKKTVGEISYTLVKDYTDTTDFGCDSNCVYQKDDDVGSRYCFAKGGQEVVCSKMGEKFEDRSIDDFAICNNDFQEFIGAVANSGGTLDYNLCDGTDVGSCTGAPCSTIFADVKCGRPVTDHNDSSKCKSEIGTIGIILIQLGKTSCINYGVKGSCPKSYVDPKCNCCKYPGYTGNCGKKCRCKASCDWFAQKTIYCSQYTSACCSCDSSSYKTKCCHICNSCPSPSPSPLPLPGPPSDSPSDCKDCYLAKHADDPFCKCNCLCRAIMEKTGSDCQPPWTLCSQDYAFCCECLKTEYKDFGYEKVCPDYCKQNVPPKVPNAPAKYKAKNCNFQ